jgi:hypothetical protein
MLNAFNERFQVWFHSPFPGFAWRTKSRRKKMNFCMSVLQIQIAVKRKVLPALQKLGLLQLDAEGIRVNAAATLSRAGGTINNWRVESWFDLRIAMSRGQTADQLQLWIDARKRHRLSHEQLQMARELGLNPKKLGKLDNHHQEPWKLPLPAFIERLYRKRFGKDRPDVVFALEERARLHEQKKKLGRSIWRLRHD